MNSKIGVNQMDVTEVESEITNLLENFLRVSLLFSSPSLLSTVSFFLFQNKTKQSKTNILCRLSLPSHLARQLSLEKILFNF